MAKLPALQFYPGDWRKDVGVQSLTYHDRGVWFEMLMLMHESEQRGYLMLGGVAMSDEILASLLHLPIESLRETVATLVSRGVTVRDKRTNALVNRRMIRDDIQLAENRGRLAKWRKAKKRNSNGNEPETPAETEKQRLSSSSSSTSVSNTVPEDSLSPEHVALAVKETLALGGTQLTICLMDICRAQMAAGEQPDALRDRMVSAWRQYQGAMPKLKWAYSSPEKFFSGDCWHDPKLWPWKDGATPPPSASRRKYWEPSEIPQ